VAGGEGEGEIKRETRGNEPMENIDCGRLSPAAHWTLRQARCGREGGGVGTKVGREREGEGVSERAWGRERGGEVGGCWAEGVEDLGVGVQGLGFRV
jgi:hypothetical protein